MSSVVELPPVSISNVDDGSTSSIRIFQLNLNDITVELSSIGASITKVLIPNYSQKQSGASSTTRDDVVLSYASPKDQYDDKNKPFFGAIVGRVANRIKDGKFQLMQKAESNKTLETYQLEKNNHPNHLHGGYDGFCTKIWSANIVNDTEVEFMLTSPDGDCGYPAGIQVTATYSLIHIGDDGVKLCLKMNAKLLPGETKATPIALAQHSYFNLASHSSPNRILDHTLHLNCTKFTPFDNTSIPTREIQHVNNAMDFCKPKSLADALIQYGEERAGLDHVDAKNNVQRILNYGDASEVIARVPKQGGVDGANLDGGSPYGFDHNYAIDTSSEDDGLRLAAVLSHTPTGRSMRVLTSAPGMQLYTSNYLDRKTPNPAICKGGTRYNQWQGICLETQTYPDSIFPDDTGVDGEDEFAKGRCFILRPGSEDYHHIVCYEFRNILSGIRPTPR